MRKTLDTIDNTFGDKLTDLIKNKTYFIGVHMNNNISINSPPNFEMYIFVFGQNY